MGFVLGGLGGGLGWFCWLGVVLLFLGVLLGALFLFLTGVWAFWVFFCFVFLVLVRYTLGLELGFG